VYRWYSKTFHTPLEQAFDIPVEFILQVYFEEYFEGLEDEDLDEHLNEITETEDQRKAREEALDAEKASEQELLEMSRKQNEVKLKEKANKIANVTITKKLPDQIATINQTLKEVTDAIKDEMKSDAPEID